MILPPKLQHVADTVRVLRDRVLVKRLEYKNETGLFVAGVTLEKGVVVGIGAGRQMRRKVRFDNKMGHMSTGQSLYFEDGAYTGKVRPMRVKVGDVVEFSPRNYTTVDFDRIGYTGIGDLLFVWEQAIYYRDPDESQHSAMLWQQSAGYDRRGNFMSGADEWQRTTAR